MTTDALVLLKAEHKEIKDVFKKFERAGSGATKLKSSLVKKMIELLTIHTYLENELIYPEVRRLLPDLADDILESYEEHHVADVLVLELFVLPATAERFAPKTTVLMELVSHHIDEEEQNWFPQVRAGVGRKQLSELGVRMLEMKKKAPRSPAQPSAMKKTLDAVIR
jgi:hemerythrin-like domain-containing protein